MTFHNYMDFVAMNKYLTIRYEVNCDGEVIQSGDVDRVPAILPHAEGTIRLNIQVPAKGLSYLKLIYQLKEATELLPAGFDLGFDEVELEAAVDGRNQKALAIWNKKDLSEDNLKVTEDDRYTVVSGKNFSYRYDKTVGNFCSMVFEGRELLDKPMSLNIWRAPTDNDRKQKLEWMAAHYDKAISLSEGASQLSAGMASAAENLNTTISANEQILAGLQAMQAELSAAGQDTTSVDTMIGTLSQTIAGQRQIAANLQADGALGAGASTISAGAQQLSAGATDLKTGMDSLYAGAQTLSQGLTEASGGASTLVAGVSTVQSGAAALSEGAQQVSSGAAAVSAGSDTLVNGVNQLTSGSQAVCDGFESLTSGTNALVGGVSALADGSQLVCDGFGTLESGTGALISGVNQLTEGADSLVDGTGKLSAGADSLNSGAAQLSGGSTNLLGGMNQLRDSSNALVAGVQQLTDGAGQLYNGLGTLADGTKTLHNGAQELTEGGLELRDGMRKFYEEGITKLSATIMEKVPDMLSRLRAINVMKYGIIAHFFVHSCCLLEFYDSSINAQSDNAVTSRQKNFDVFQRASARISPSRCSSC